MAIGVLRYEGSVKGFREGLRELRKAAMAGRSLGDTGTVVRVQRKFKAAQLKDLHRRILAGRSGRPA